MSKFAVRPRRIVFYLFVLLFFAACGTAPETDVKVKSTEMTEIGSKTGNDSRDENSSVKRIVSSGPTIEIKQNSPADTVRVFYDRLRKGKVKDAIMLTNLRPAVEGLTDSELRDLGTDFGSLARQVPREMPINGEILTGNTASVTVRMPNPETKKVDVQEIKLRRADKNWTILVADKVGERMARKEGINYFFALRMDVHHKEARAMLDRIGKAQMIYSMKNGGKFTDLNTLVGMGFVPQDAMSSASTGYRFDIKLAMSGVTYTALATPAEYGKTGKLSFALKITRKHQPALISKDLGGKALLN